MNTNSSEWVLVVIALVGAVVNYLQQREQNQIFREQNQIFADQGGKSMAPENPRLTWLKRYWPTLVTVLLFLLIGYDIYSRHRVVPVVPWWFYVILLLIVLVVGLVGRSTIAQTKLPSHVAPVRTSKLVILRAVYGAGAGADVDVTESLQRSPRDGLVIPVDNSLVSGTDPAYGVRKRLVVDYSYGDGTVHSAGRMESTPDNFIRMVLPEDPQTRQVASELERMKAESGQREIELHKCRQIRDIASADARTAKERVSELEKELSHCQAAYSADKTNLLNEKAEAGNRALELERKLSDLQKPDKTLRSRTMAICGDLRKFLKDHGPEPAIERQPTEAVKDFQARFRATVVPWRAKLHGDYRLRFSESVSRIRDEIIVTRGLDDESLNVHIERAGMDPSADEKVVEEIIKGLWNMALELDGQS